MLPSVIWIFSLHFVFVTFISDGIRLSCSTCTPPLAIYQTINWCADEHAHASRVRQCRAVTSKKQARYPCLILVGCSVHIFRTFLNIAVLLCICSSSFFTVHVCPSVPLRIGRLNAINLDFISMNMCMCVCLSYNHQSHLHSGCYFLLVRGRRKACIFSVENCFVCRFGNFLARCYRVVLLLFI